MILHGQLLQYLPGLRAEQHGDGTLLLAVMRVRPFIHPGLANPVRGELMFREVPGLGERFPADFARVGFDPGMNPLVAVQVTLLDERLGAVAAMVGPLSGVQAVVLDQVRLLGEPLPAQLARVRPLSCKHDREILSIQ